MQEDRFIDSGYKTEFIVKFCLIVILTSCILGFVLYFLWYRDLGATYTQAISTLVSLKKILVPVIFITILIQVVLISAATIFFILFVSHRIAGPIYRLEKSLERMGEGDLTIVKIHLRTGDQMQRLARSFENMCRGVQQKIVLVRNSFQRIKDRKERLASMVKGTGYSRDELGSVFKDLSRETEELRSKLTEFKV